MILYQTDRVTVHHGDAIDVLVEIDRTFAEISIERLRRAEQLWTEGSTL